MGREGRVRQRGHVVDSRTVVVVEDEPFIRMGVVDALAEAGFSVLEAADAQAALAILADWSVAAVITDVRMPGFIDGLELAQIVAREWPEIAIFVMSGHAYADDERMPAKATFIPKPFVFKAVTQQIAAAVG